MGEEQVCSGGGKLIFSCSGAADVGWISDLAARRMTSDGAGKMFCLAGIGGRVEPIMEKAKVAVKILAIDGCSLHCVKRTLENAGFSEFAYLRVTDLGLEKGQSPASDENVAKVVDKATGLLN